MLLSKKNKLEVSAQDAQTLEFMQGKCRGLYNWWVMRLRNGERWPGWKRAKATLQESKAHDPELHQVYGKLLQEVYFRLDSAMQVFFRHLKAGATPGFPRVRPRHQFFTLCYPAMYATVEGNALTLPTGGGDRWGPKHYPNIAARLTEAPPTGYREVAVSRDARGNYYASFVYEAATQEKVPSGVVAFDLGIKTLATGMNEQGCVYRIGGFKGSRWYNKQLDKIRSKHDRCKKRSRRYLHLPKVYRRVAEKKRRKQQDCLHKASHLIARKLVESTIVIGELSQRQMVTKAHQEQNRHHNRAVFNDWSVYGFVQMLVYKCLLAGNTQDMPLWKRTYRCVNCGLVMDRDENSAVNILNRFFARLGPHTERISEWCAGVFPAIKDV